MRPEEALATVLDLDAGAHVAEDILDLDRKSGDRVAYPATVSAHSSSTPLVLARRRRTLMVSRVSCTEAASASAAGPARPAVVSGRRGWMFQRLRSLVRMSPKMNGYLFFWSDRILGERGAQATDAGSARLRAAPGKINLWPTAWRSLR